MLISHVSPRRGIGGSVDPGFDNAPFTKPELARIAASIEEIKQTLSERSDVSREQLDLIARKLDDARDASERVGRKGWKLSYFWITDNTITDAALNSELADALFDATRAAFSWLVDGGFQLLQ